MEWALSLTNEIPLTFVSVGNRTTDGANGLLDLIHFLAGLPTPPTVVTFNFGENENLMSQSVVT